MRDLSRKSERKAFVAKRRNMRSPSAKWRGLPATDEQWKVLRRIGRRTKQVFPADITRGEASDLIAVRFKQDPAAKRAHRLAQKRRDQAA